MIRGEGVEEGLTSKLSSFPPSDLARSSSASSSPDKDLAPHLVTDLSASNRAHASASGQPILSTTPSTLRSPQISPFLQLPLEIIDQIALSISEWQTLHNFSLSCYSLYDIYRLEAIYQRMDQEEEKVIKWIWFLRDAKKGEFGYLSFNLTLIRNAEERVEESGTLDLGTGDENSSKLGRSMVLLQAKVIDFEKFVPDIWTDKYHHLCVTLNDNPNDIWLDVKPGDKYRLMDEKVMDWDADGLNDRLYPATGNELNLRFEFPTNFRGVPLKLAVGHGMRPMR